MWLPYLPIVNGRYRPRNYLFNSANTERLSLRSFQRSWPSRPKTSPCTRSHMGIAVATASLPQGVIDNSLVRRSSPGVIFTSPRVTNGRSNRDNEVRSITRSSARSLTVIDPTETNVTSTGSWVDRRPDGFKASSYIWVMIRDIFRRFKQTQAATMWAHLSTSGPCLEMSKNLSEGMIRVYMHLFAMSTVSVRFSGTMLDFPCRLWRAGEPGIGQTRTVQELTTYAGLRGAQALWGRSYEEQAIRSYVREREPEQLLSEMGAGAPYPITVIEALWALAALQSFWRRHRQEAMAV